MWLPALLTCGLCVCLTAPPRLPACACRREVDSVVLPYLNRARLSYTTRAFYSTGVRAAGGSSQPACPRLLPLPLPRTAGRPAAACRWGCAFRFSLPPAWPSVPAGVAPRALCLLPGRCHLVHAGRVPETLEGNYREPLMPWSDPHNGRVVLGATVEEACAGPQQLHDALAAFSGAARRRALAAGLLHADRMHHRCAAAASPLSALLHLACCLALPSLAWLPSTSSSPHLTLNWAFRCGTLWCR